jgi:hypothetical protein
MTGRQAGSRTGWRTDFRFEPRGYTQVYSVWQELSKRSFAPPADTRSVSGRNPPHPGIQNGTPDIKSDSPAITMD